MDNSFYKEYLIRKVIGVNRILKKKIEEYRELTTKPIEGAGLDAIDEALAEQELIKRCRHLKEQKLEVYIQDYEFTLKQITKAINGEKAKKQSEPHLAKVLSFKNENPKPN